MGNLLAGRILIAIYGNGFNAEALEGNNHFFSELTRAEKHDLSRGWGKRGTYCRHGKSP
jgi:hypothetical protein